MTDPAEEAAPDAPVRYERTSTGLEFDRVAFFSDAVFAIAMTLLVVGIGIPTVSDADLGDALREKRAEITSFFISFVVIGAYWRSHHRFWAGLKAVDNRLIVVNLFYLAAIAFTPFPTALAGKYTAEPVSIVIYAITLAIASGLQAVSMWLAHRHDLLRERLSSRSLRYLLVASVIPVAVFLASIPIALHDTVWALYSWLLIIPLEWGVDRWLRPDDLGPAYR
ncbi:MAG: DUF1211 domain-containing protein [Actinobacteria bacterium]|nr:DUF1211 domain-containing protein [Actinomycetota bacterium]